MLLPTLIFLRVVAIALRAAESSQQSALKPTVPETFWPLSVTGWAALGGFVFLFGEKIYKLWRHAQSPVEQKIEDSFGQCIRKIDETVDHFNAEVERVEKQLTRTLAEYQSAEVERRNTFREAVSHDINGWAARISENAGETDRLGQAFEVQARAMIKFESESKTDRVNINSRLSVMESEVRALGKAQDSMELRLTKAINESESRISTTIRAVVDGRGPRHG